MPRQKRARAPLHLAAVIAAALSVDACARVLHYRAINGDAVDFDDRGVDAALVDSLMVADLRWTGRLLSRLSERQWLDAFRAGGYTADQSARYVRKTREKMPHAVGA